MENTNESEQITRIEKKIDEIILNYTIKPNYYDLRQNKDIKLKKAENRKAINKILYVLPQLEKFSELKDISNRDLEYITDNYH